MYAYTMLMYIIHILYSIILYFFYYISVKMKILSSTLLKMAKVKVDKKYKLLKFWNKKL